jgi:hypothetical protein
MPKILCGIRHNLLTVKYHGTVIGANYLIVACPRWHLHTAIDCCETVTCTSWRSPSNAPPHCMPAALGIGVVAPVADAVHDATADGSDLSVFPLEICGQV